MILTILGSGGVLSQCYQIHIIKSSVINWVKKPIFSVDNSENQPRAFGSTISPNFYPVVQVHSTYLFLIRASRPESETRVPESKVGTRTRVWIPLDPRSKWVQNYCWNGQKAPFFGIQKDQFLVWLFDDNWFMLTFWYFFAFVCPISMIYTYFPSYGLKLGNHECKNSDLSPDSDS